MPIDANAVKKETETYDWDRLESNSISTSLEEGLEARIADPLWMLARQWQVGEFKGEDAGSPILVTAAIARGRVERFRTNGGQGDSLPIDSLGQPLETFIECEDITAGPSRQRVAAEAGMLFLRALPDKLRAAFREKFPLKFDLDEQLVPGDAAVLNLLKRRACDGRDLFRALSAPKADAARLPDGPVVPPAEQTKVREAAARWTAWYADRFREPAHRKSAAWKPRRMEYQDFSVAAPALKGEVVLTADEYPGGHLDWFSFDGSTDTALGVKKKDFKTRTQTILASPIQYGGMPASRWWEFEDRDIYFGDIANAPEDIARAVIAGFAAVHGDDWFMVPFMLPAGSVSRVMTLKIRNTFGEEKRLLSAAEKDGLNLKNKENRAWKYFELSGLETPSQGRSPWMYIPAALSGALNSRPVEEIVLTRDQMANMGWAIERRIENQAGRSLQRRLRARPEPEPKGDTWVYRLGSDVPDHWIPLIPVRVSGGADMVLQRGRMPDWRDDQGAKGVILQPDTRLLINEEEVPNGGVVITRHYQYARDTYGGIHLWMARRKRPSRGNEQSGLVFDRILRFGDETNG